MGMFEQSPGDRAIHTPTYNAMVRICRRLGRLSFNNGDFVVQDGKVSLFRAPAVIVSAVVVGGGKRWESTAWLGTESDFLKIPYDGVTAPSYVASMPAMTAMPADDGSDPRAEALYIILSETPGPVFHVGRA
jgi:hypothetical protein